MDLIEALRSNPAVREFTDEPVSDSELASCSTSLASRPAAAIASPGMLRS